MSNQTTPVLLPDLTFQPPGVPVQNEPLPRVECTFTIPGMPVSKGRPRVTKSGITYTPKKTRVFENLVCMAFEQACATVPVFEYWVSLRVSAYFPYPKSWPKWRRKYAQAVPQRKQTRPDLDNVLKAVLDGLDGVAFDDGAVAEIAARKWYDIQPRTEVEVVWHEIRTKQRR